MRAVLLALVMGVQVTFPLPGGRPNPSPAPGSSPLPDQSTISGQVRTKEGEPIPLARINVQTRQDSTRADQRGSGVGWPGTVAQVRRDGTFRVEVPGGTTYEVCAEVPGRPKQCRYMDVSSRDLETLVFTF